VDLKTLSHLHKIFLPFGNGSKITSDGIEENSGSVRFISQNSHSFLRAKMSNCM